MLVRKTYIQQIIIKSVFYSHFKLLFQIELQTPTMYLR